MKKTLQEVRDYINEGVYDPVSSRHFFLQVKRFKTVRLL